jgi:hypothetical protein
MRFHTHGDHLDGWLSEDCAKDWAEARTNLLASVVSLSSNCLQPQSSATVTRLRLRLCTIVENGGRLDIIAATRAKLGSL